VLVAMISNHYAMLTQHAWNWLLLVVLMTVGVLVRQFFVLRHKGRQQWGLVAASLALLAGLIVWLAPARSSSAVNDATPSVAQVQAIVQQRCVMCHNAQLQNKGVALHTSELLARHAQAVYQQAVLQKLMPLNNATQMTEDERLVIRRWVAAGAPSR